MRRVFWAMCAALCAASCGPFTAPEDECFSHNDCGPCERCENGSCAPNPAVAADPLCIAPEPPPPIQPPPPPPLPPPPVRPPAPQTGALAGIWSGNVDVMHREAGGPPIDRFTIAFDERGEIYHYHFGSFPDGATFGAAPAAIPLRGGGVVEIAGETFEFEIVRASFDDAGFDLAFGAHAVEASFPARYAVDLRGVVDGDHMTIEYRFDGIAEVEYKDATASGTVRREY